MKCPGCGRALAGNPRSCGYCGISLVGDYFSKSRSTANTMPKPVSTGAGGVAGLTLGIFGSLSLLVALVFHISVLFRMEELPSIDIGWWLKTLLMTVLPVVYLVQVVALRGMRFSLRFDASWLFVSGCGLSLVALTTLMQGIDPLAGSTATPYLVAVGWGLILVASITGIFAFGHN